MKRIKIVFFVFVLLITNNVFAQFDLDPTEVQLGDIFQDDYVEFTFTIFSWAQDGTNYTVTTPYPWPDWLDVEPMEFTLDYAQEQEIECSGICNDFMSYYGNHAASIEFQDDNSFPNWNWASVWWTSHPPPGPEDFFQWLEFTEIFDELETITYSIVFHDDPPTTPSLDWNFKMLLYSNVGIYIYYEDVGSGLQPQTWQFTAPALPEDLVFTRTDNGEISGRVLVTTTDIGGYINDVSRPFKIRKEPSKPSYFIENTDGNEIILHFHNHITGATSYEIYYDTDPNPPFNGTGLNQGDSPILTNEVTSFNINGLQQCTDYYFAIKAINSYGESELSDVKKVTVFDTPNSLPLYYHYNDVIISESKTLQSNNYYDYYFGNLIIESGTTITFEGGTFYFEEDSKIIIEPGGKLILDGATCTAPCGQTWTGIEVWGDSEEHQFTFEDVCAQGILELKGGATIENAETGVLLAARDEQGGIIDSKTGGIIKADFIDNPTQQVANFLNNRRAIDFRSYHNYNPSTYNEMPNISLIENCTFEINQDYLFEGTLWFNIYMYDVYGVKIRGNTFVNNKTTFPAGFGIYASHAGFRVEAFCSDEVSPCPEESLHENIFTNFFIGIYLLNPGSYTLTVKNAEFYDNSYGIYLHGVNNASLIFNKFYLGQASDEEGEMCDGKSAAYGIDLTNCTGFAIEENQFSKATGAPLGNYIGIRVTDCPSESDVIYRNEFTGVSVGNQAEGWNRSDPTYDLTGVTYYCNQNLDNNYDFYVADESIVGGYMGDYDYPSGNTLSSNAQVQFQNDYTEAIIYYFNQDEPDEVLSFFSTYVYPVPIGYENTCPSHYGGGGGTDGRIVLTESEKQGKEAEYLQSLNDYNSVQALYTGLLDGGNTEALKIDVETSWPDDMWELRAELLGKSPHLSKEVLITAADKTDVLPESVLFEILSANPDELRKEELMSYLKNKEQPLPQYMIDILEQLANGVSYKTLLLSEMASYHAKMISAAQDIIRSIVNEDEPDLEELRNWLDNIGGMEADKQIIETYLMEGDYSSAQSLLDMLPALYELSGDELVKHNDYKSFKILMMNLDQEDRTIFDLNESELASIVDLAENGNGSAKTSAQGILEFAYNYDYCNCPDLPENIELKSSSIDMGNLAKAKGLDISAEPNPVSVWTAFDYTLPLTESVGVIEITDNSGKIVQQIKVTQQLGQYVLDTRSYKPGIYYYSLRSGNLQRTGKLVVK